MNAQEWQRRALEKRKKASARIHAAFNKVVVMAAAEDAGAREGEGEEGGEGGERREEKGEGTVP